MRKEEKSQVQGVMGCAAQIGYGTAAAFIITVLLLILSALGVSCGFLRENHIPQITIAAGILGVFIGAVLTNTQKKIWHGILVSACFVLILAVIKIFLYRNYAVSADTVTMIAAIFCAGTLSGFSSKGKQKGKGKGRRYTRK